MARVVAVRHGSVTCVADGAVDGSRKTFTRASSSNPRTIVIDTTAPSGSGGDPGDYLRGLANLTYSTAAPDVSSVQFEFSPAGMNAWAAVGAADIAPPYEASWNTGKKIEGGNKGHRPTVKGGYFPVPPVDSTQDMRAEMSLILESLGIPVEVFHHEVAGAGQNEIGTKFSTLVQRADWSQLQKYVIQNVANAYGKTATFMPKPIVGDNGSGMHVHQSVWKGGKNLFAGEGYAGLSDFALYYIGGIIKHARALNAITNPGTNSYKRLVPGFEAPVKLAYSARNRSASIRIPYVANPKGRRIECRFPDPLMNPYLGFAAMLMAGLDGVENKIHPGEAATKDLYHLPPEEDAKIPTVCHSLDQALEYLDKGRSFLTKGGVFTDTMIDAYIELKMQEVTRFRMTTHPIEFDMYYSL